MKQANQYLHDENGEIDPTLEQSMALSLGRVLSKNSASNGRRRPADTEIYHISDWLKAAVLNNEPWLQNVDDQGRPKKLMKFSTVEQIIAEADKAMLKAAQKGRDIVLNESQEKLVVNLDDGFSIVELLAPEALDRESAYMQHCIGNGGYDDKVGSDHFKYLSLRDASNKPHATMELEKSGSAWKLLQFQGKQNKMPLDRYVHMLTPFFERIGFLIIDGTVKDSIPYIIDVQGEWHDLGSQLPDELTCDAFRPERFNKMPSPPIRMPSGCLEVKKSFEVNNKILVGFPTVAKLKSNELTPAFQFNSVAFNDMPPHIEFEGHVRMSAVDFNSSPETIMVDGDCGISFSSATAMPRTITATGKIFIANLDRKELETELKAGSNVTIWNCNIEKMRDGLLVDGQLMIHKSTISELPKGLVVESLILSQTNITSLPEGTIVKKEIKIDNPDDFSDIPSSVDDDVKLVWVDSSGPTLSKISGPDTVGEWRSMRHQMRI